MGIMKHKQVSTLSRVDPDVAAFQAPVARDCGLAYALAWSNRCCLRTPCVILVQERSRQMFWLRTTAPDQYGKVLLIFEHFYWKEFVYYRKKVLKLIKI